MADNPINRVQQVVELEGGPAGVNEHLKNGWILLHIYSNSVDSDHGPSQNPVYVLGWPLQEPPR